MKILTNRQYNVMMEVLVGAVEEIQDLEEQRLKAARWIAQLEEVHLENLRAIQSLAATILLVRANPEADVAEEVEALLRDVSDQVALIEEHKT